MNLENQAHENHFNSSKQQELLLSHQEYKIIQNLLPHGYSFAVSNKNTRLQQSRKAADEEEVYPPAEKVEKPKRNAYAEAERTIRGTNENFKKCVKILGIIKRNANAGPFMEPVDPVALGIPTYFSVIKSPMDLSTVENRLKNNEYDSPEQFDSDMRLIWGNARVFNPAGSQVHRMAESLSTYFEDLLKREDDLGSKAPKLPAERSKNKSIAEEEAYAPKQSKVPTSKNMMERYVRSKINTTQKKKKPSGNNTQSAPVPEKPVADFKEDVKQTEAKPVSNTEPLSRPQPVPAANAHENGGRSVQPNFRIDTTANNKLTSESSFISDLEDSD